ncbi:MAG: hypothetical protein QUS09_04225 [Methanotrichaceae archaeon]|nr:hypothetical protein [Methanotrichaceae archaeon]
MITTGRPSGRPVCIEMLRTGNTRAETGVVRSSDTINPLSSNDFYNIDWYTGLWSSRTSPLATFRISISRPDIRIARQKPRCYRNPVHFAMELQAEMSTDHLTRQQLADRHGISLDRVIQWLALLKLPDKQLEEIASMGDYWDRRVVTERQIRRLRQSR